MSFLWPPRPENAITPEFIPMYESKGWIAQIKKNGTCNVISVDEDGNVTFRTRHNELNKAWTPPQETVKFFSQFKGCTFVGELLHNKHPSVKNTIYLFDVLVWKGQSLVGVSYEGRYNHVIDVTGAPGATHARVLLAKNYFYDFTSLYEGLNSGVDEGIVLKNPKAKLQPCFKQSNNQGWQVKVRRQTKNYGF